MLTITINTSPQEEGRLAIEVARLQQLGEEGLTVNEFVSRMLLKMVRGWMEHDRERVLQENLSFIKQVVDALAEDPQQAAKLAALGVQVGQYGTLEWIGGSPGGSPDEGDA